MLDVNAIRKEFPILERQVYGKPLIYLDSAATAQKPQCVIDCINRLHTTRNANIHRGIHLLAEETTSDYENARAIVAKFINAHSTNEIVFTSGATASINLVAYSFARRYFQSGDNMIITEMEHHSNIVPWQLVCADKGVEIRVLPFDHSGRLQIEKLTELIDGRTKIIALTQTSNVLGSNNPLEQLIATAHTQSVPVLVDGCQGIVHQPIDVQALGADFYAFSGHKIYGPTGIGVLYGKEHYLNELPPFMGGGDMIATVSLTRGTTWAELPLKFEAGTSNFVGAIALATALDYVSAFDNAELEAHQQSLLHHFTNAITKKIDGLKIYGTTADKAPIISFNIEGAHSMDVAQIVDKLGVAIRSGTHCAEPVMHHYGVGAMCRASMAIYNTIYEVDAAIEALSRATNMLR